METKQCTKCKETKLATLEYFGRNKNGFQSWCKECHKKDQIGRASCRERV